jgi:hypothetical protein
VRYAKPENAVDENAAPGLWAMWNEFDGATPRARRTLAIGVDLNASIAEHRRYLGLVQRHLTMTIGLPLLIVLDERTARAVVAHEVAHARLQHTSGGVNLREFIAAVENLFDHVDPANTISGRIAYLLLNPFLNWVTAEYRMMSRQNELVADRDAAERVGPDDMARALLLLHFADAGIKELIAAPLEKELLGALRTPAPPLQRLIEQLDAVWAHRPADGAVPEDEQDPQSGHPPLRARLANLGFATIPQMELIKTSAADTVLSRAAMTELLKTFNERWRRHAKALVELRS